MGLVSLGCDHQYGLVRVLHVSSSGSQFLCLPICPLIRVSGEGRFRFVLYRRERKEGGYSGDYRRRTVGSFLGRWCLSFLLWVVVPLFRDGAPIFFCRSGYPIVVFVFVLFVSFLATSVFFGVSAHFNGSKGER